MIEPIRYAVTPYLTPEAVQQREALLVERIATEAREAGRVLPDSDYWRLPIQLQLAVGIAIARTYGAV